MKKLVSQQTRKTGSTKSTIDVNKHVPFQHRTVDNVQHRWKLTLENSQSNQHTFERTNGMILDVEIEQTLDAKNNQPDNDGVSRCSNRAGSTVQNTKHTNKQQRADDRKS